MSELHEFLDKIKREKLNAWICVDAEALKTAHGYNSDIPETIKVACFNGTVVLMFKNGEFVNTIGGDTIQFMMNTPENTETYWSVSYEGTKTMKMCDRFKGKFGKYGGVCSIVMQSIDNIKQMYANENEEGFEEHMKLLQESGVFGDKILPEDKEFIDKFLKSTKEEKGAKNNGR